MYTSPEVKVVCVLSDVVPASAATGSNWGIGPIELPMIPG